MDGVASCDLYEVAYYLLSGCTIEEIVCLPVDGRSVVQFTLAGAKLEELQLSYLKGRAEVNLLRFRRAYGQVNAYAYEAKKRVRRHSSAGGGA